MMKKVDSNWSIASCNKQKLKANTFLFNRMKLLIIAHQTIKAPRNETLLF